MSEMKIDRMQRIHYKFQVMGVDGVRRRDENLAFFGVREDGGSHPHFEGSVRSALERSRRCSRRAG